MIEIQNLTKKYADTTVLTVENLQLKAGETVGIVGNNGAGKTTLLSCILDLIPPTTGSVKLEGKEVSLSSDWKSFTNSFLDETFLINYLKAEEYFEFIGNVNRINSADIHNFINTFEHFFKGEILGNKKLIRDLSKGNQKKVGIVGALIGNPKIVVLDEPFSNLDPSTQIVLKETLKKEVAEKDMLALISSHDLSHIADISDRIIILEKGNIVKNIETHESTLEELKNYFTQQ